MKKNINYFFFICLFFLSFNLFSQTTTVTIFYNGAQAWGCCDVCGTDYMCIGSSGCGCCQPAQQTKTFMDPVPAGNMVVAITLTYYAADCSAPNVPTNLNGCLIGTAVNTVGNNTCACSSCNPVWFTATYPTGLANYVYGGMNTIYSNPPAGTEICVQRVEIQITYAPGTPPSGLGTPGTITGTNPVCPGQTYTYTVPAVPGATSYTWTVPAGSVINSGQGTNTISVTFGATTGTICVTASDGCATSPASCITITFAAALPAPTPITGPNPVCAGQTVTYSVPPVPGATTYTWTVPAGVTIVSGQGSTSITVTYGATAGIICVTAGNSCGNSSQTCITVTINPGISISVNPSAPTICSGGSIVLTASGATTYLWAPGTGLSSTTGSIVTASPTTTTTYSVTGTDVNGCTGSTTVLITVGGSIPVGITCSSPFNCAGSTTTLTGTGAVTYAWAPAAGLSATTGTTVTANPSVTTTYTVTGTDISSCQGTDTITIFINPVVTVSPVSSTFCLGNSVTLTANGALTYSWSPGTGLSSTTGTTVTSTPATNIVYTVTGSTNGCTGTAVTTVNLNPPLTVNITSNDLIICAGQNTIITGSASGGDGNYTYTWDNGIGVSSPPISVSPTTTTTYNVTLTDNCGSPPVTDNITITVSPSPTINFTANPSSGCAPLTVNFISNCSPVIQAYSWSFDDPVSGSSNISVNGNPSHTFTQSGSYNITLSVTTTDGCTGTSTISNMINTFPRPVADFTPSPVITTLDNPTITFIDNSTNASSWFWNFGDPSSGSSNITSEQSPVHSYSNQGTFVIWLTVESSGGCRDSISKEIMIKDQYTFYAPDAFTPDGDGINDYFMPTGINFDINNFELFIYDRWGGEIYRTKDMSKPWNGAVKNSNAKAESGVYVWMVKMIDNSGKSHIIYGRVSLMK